MKNNNLCRFCGVDMLPMEDITPQSDIQVGFSLWECHNCPSTVRQYTNDPDWYSILAFFNGSWYEVTQIYIENPDINKGPSLLAIYKYTIYMDENDKPNIKSDLALELNIDGKITPQNVKEKLATILTFS
jgi:hypothetical protein